MSHATFQVPISVRRHNGHLPANDTHPIGVKFVSNQVIARRAYDKYISRGRVHGFDQEDWAAARRELIAEIFEQ